MAKSKKSKPVPPLAAAPEFPLLTYLDSLVEALRGYVPKALRDFDEVSIHQARVMTRRLSAAIRLVQPLLAKNNRRRLTRSLRNLRRTLGPLRDLDVMIGRLCGVPTDDPHRDAAAWLVGKLAARRVAAREQAAAKPPSVILGKLGVWWGLREEMVDIREAIDALLAESVHLQLDAFAEQADEVTGVRVVDGAPPPDPHELRIAGKALRYTLDMASESGHPLPQDVGKAFKKMQELLGHWHDHVVLAERTMQVCAESMLTLHDTTMAIKVLDLTRASVERAGNHMDEFAGMWMAQGVDLARTIREAFPLTKPLATIGQAETAASSDLPTGVCAPPPATDTGACATVGVDDDARKQATPA